MLMRAALAIAMTLALLAAVGGAAYAVGDEQAVTAEQAQNARVSAGKSAGARANAHALRSSRRRGVSEGLRQGQRRGQRSGRRAGRERGAAEADRRAAAAATQHQQDRQDAINARQQERARNCNAPLFVEGYCPTDAEVQAENETESLCGGGHYDQARAKGIACFPPGDPRNP